MRKRPPPSEIVLGHHPDIIHLDEKSLALIGSASAENAD